MTQIASVTLPWHAVGDTGQRALVAEERTQLSRTVWSKAGDDQVCRVLAPADLRDLVGGAAPRVGSRRSTRRPWSTNPLTTNAVTFVRSPYAVGFGAQSASAIRSAAALSEVGQGGHGSLNIGGIQAAR